MTDNEPTGQVDGQVPEELVVKVSGSHWIDRVMVQGERVALMLEGTVTGLSFKRDKNGIMRRTQTVSIDMLAEPVKDMADDVTKFLRMMTDANAGQPSLLEDVDKEEEPDESGDDTEDSA